MKKSSLTPLFSFEKFFTIAMLCIVLVFQARAQNITVQPSVSTEFNIYSDISLWIQAPAGQTVNAQFHYFSSGDTTSTAVQSNLALGYSEQYTFQDIVVDCDSLWNGYVNVWLSGQDTIQSNMISWSFPCAGPVSVQFQVTEVVGLGVVVSFDYNSGGAPAALYWFTSIDGGTPFLQTVEVFGVGTYADTLEISAGQTYEVCNPEIYNGTSIMFLQECESGVMDSFVASVPDVTLTATAENDSLFVDLLVVNSGGPNSEFVVSVEKMLCGGSFEPYEEYSFNFTNEIIIDSLVSVPILFNLPNAPAWRVSVSASNDSLEMNSISTIVDVALTANPTVGLDLNDLGNGFYEAVTTWNDDNAGNVVLMYYVDDVFVGQIVPTQNPAVFELPVQISSYSSGIVEVVLESNACLVSATLEIVPACSTNPVYLLGNDAITNITSISAQIELESVNFNGCVETGMVGVVLMSNNTILDTIWYGGFVNTQTSQNYTFFLDNLYPGTTYLCYGILYAEQHYFSSGLSQAFTTPAPYLTNFSVNWDQSMIATVFIGCNTVQFPTAGVRVYHNDPSPGEINVSEYELNESSISIDYFLTNQYGDHVIWVELYDIETETVFQTSGFSIHTYQEIVSVEEIGNQELQRTIERFDSVDIYNLAGQKIQSFSRGEVLNPNPNLPKGIYLFVGWNGNKATTSKLKL